MRNMIAMEKKVKEVNELLNANRLNASVYAINELVIAVEIEWGDWKHEHLRCDWLITDWAEKIGLVIVNGGETVTESDDCDCYSAIHRYALVG